MVGRARLNNYNGLGMKVFRWILATATILTTVSCFSNNPTEEPVKEPTKTAFQSQEPTKTEKPPTATLEEAVTETVEPATEAPIPSETPKIESNLEVYFNFGGKGRTVWQLPMEGNYFLEAVLNDSELYKNDTQCLSVVFDNVNFDYKSLPLALTLDEIANSLLCNSNYFSEGTWKVRLYKDSIDELNVIGEYEFTMVAGQSTIINKEDNTCPAGKYHPSNAPNEVCCNDGDLYDPILGCIGDVL